MGLVCAQNRCGCGQLDQPCCAANMCQTGLVCEQNRCSCGRAGQACCPGSACNRDLYCAETTSRCACAKLCARGVVVRANGSVLTGNQIAWYRLLDASGAAFQADDIVSVGQPRGTAVC